VTLVDPYGYTAPVLIAVVVSSKWCRSIVAVCQLEMSYWSH